MSPELQLFYREIQAWIDDGQRPHACFSRTFALCFQLTLWSAHKGFTRPKAQELDWEQMELFESELREVGLFPFNRREDDPMFSVEIVRGETYKNPRRLKWIKDHVS